MGKNIKLSEAKRAKNDEFYTQYCDIEKEMEAYLDFDKEVFRGKTVLLPCDDPEWSNFTKYFVSRFSSLGLKKLISTSYAQESKKYKAGWTPTLFESTNPKFNAKKSEICGKIFTLTHDTNNDGRIDYEDLQWEYLQGDGDFRSEEVCKLRDEADIIITNPPFSLFREFLAWIMQANKKFAILGNMNAITYKEVFPPIKENKIWLGATIHSGDREFEIPKGYPISASGWRIDEKGRKYIKVKGVRWFTNLEHGRRHEPLVLMTMENNKLHNPKIIAEKSAYQKYDNYNAIEIPATKLIPADYTETMGVPISFLDKFCPEQFEILGLAAGRYDPDCLRTKLYTAQDSKNYGILNAASVLKIENNYKPMYARILIRHKKSNL